MMLRTTLVRNLSRFARLTRVPARNMQHIKNMIDENVRVKAQEINDTPLLQTTDRVYKPSRTIEFNRDGEVLLYSANPIKNSTIYFKYPYVLCT
jgi:hypothetical protein